MAVELFRISCLNPKYLTEKYEGLKNITTTAKYQNVPEDIIIYIWKVTVIYLTPKITATATIS